MDLVIGLQMALISAGRHTRFRDDSCDYFGDKNMSRRSSALLVEALRHNGSESSRNIARKLAEKKSGKERCPG